MVMFQNLRRSLDKGMTLKVRCGSCAHEAAWSRAEAVERLGTDASPFEIRRKLRCGVCGAGWPDLWI